MIFMIPIRNSFQSISRGLVSLASQASFVLLFPTPRKVSPLLNIGVSQGIAAGIGISNFLRAFFMMSLNSSSFGSLNYHESFRRDRVLVFRWPIFAFPYVWMHLTCVSTFPAFFRRVQFDSRSHVMAINETSCNRPEVILASASSCVESS